MKTWAWVPVHCCCHPGKRLGWVPIAPRPFRQIVFRCVEPWPWLPDGIPKLEWKSISTEVAPLTIGHETFPAVNSADEPIEVWRRVPGFTEQEPPQ